MADRENPPEVVAASARDAAVHFTAIMSLKLDEAVERYGANSRQAVFVRKRRDAGILDSRKILKLDEEAITRAQIVYMPFLKKHFTGNTPHGGPI